MNEAPQLVHEQQGLKIVKNSGNQFCVCTLHHTADPAKRSPEWRREAAAGMTIEQAARELDIDYTAVMGAKVFPEIIAGRASIVVGPPYPDFGPHVKYFGGFDYGTRNPSSFHVYTVEDGITYSLWELFEPCQNIELFVAKMKEFEYFGAIRWIAMDPSCWAPTQQQKEGLVSIHELFYKAGIRNLVKGLQDEDSWIAKIRQYWSNPEESLFKIFDRCPNQIREFETAIYDNQSERQLLTSAYKESIANKDNHSLDDCKYYMSKAPAAQQQNLWKDPIMVNRWAVRQTHPGPAPMKNDGRGYSIP